MFQNITAEYTENEINKKIDMRKIINRFFTKSNIIMYILSFMVSMVGFNGTIFPFGLAIIAAACSLGIPVVAIILLTTIGTFISFGAQDAIIHLMTAIVFIVGITLIKPTIAEHEDENEKLRLSKHLFISALIVQAVKVLSTQILIYNVLEAYMFCIVLVIFYKIFVNSLVVIKDLETKRVFATEELIGTCLLFTIAISAFGELAIFGVSIRNVLSILIVLIVGWKNGVLVGGTIGITIGVVLGIIGVNEPIMIASFAISGLIAGALNRLGRIGVIIGFIIGNGILTYVTNGNLTAIIHLREIFVASIALLFVPKNFEIDLQEILNKRHLFPVTNQRILDAHKETVYKINSVSETITQIADSYETTEKSKETPIYIETRDNYKADLINNISNLVDNVIYEDLVNEENGILDDIYNALTESENEEITLEELLAIFENHNNYIIGLEENIELKTEVLAVLKAINYTYKINRLNYIWKRKMNESRKNVSQELKGVSKVISTIVEEVEDDDEQINAKRQQIKKILLNKGILVTDVTIKEKEGEKILIKLYTKEKYANKTNVIEKILSKIFNQEIVERKTEEYIENQYVKFYGARDKYGVQFGLAKTGKNNDSESGDSYTQICLKDGKVLYALSDGMGSGANASKSSRTAIAMLEKLLKEGFDKEASLSLINSTMVLNSNEDMYSTLDITIFDLYKGNIECIKNGACPTYIKNKEKVYKIEDINLPSGLLNNIELIVHDYEVSENDIVIMCSDGVLESKQIPEVDWLEEILRKITIDNPQKIADLILNESIDNNMGMPKDDMTILVAKIRKI